MDILLLLYKCGWLDLSIRQCKFNYLHQMFRGDNIVPLTGAIHIKLNQPLQPIRKRAIWVSADLDLHRGSPRFPPLNKSGRLAHQSSEVLNRTVNFLLPIQISQSMITKLSQLKLALR